MPDLTTTHLKCLLKKATPGPWEAEDLSFCECCIDVKAPAALVCTPDMDDAPLIALAPQLAEELIRLRGEIKGLITAMEDKATTGESQSPAVIAGYLKEIVLGETK
mgnify:FL=1